MTKSIGAIIDGELAEMDRLRDRLIGSVHKRNEKISLLRAEIKQLEKDNVTEQKEIHQIDANKAKAITKALKSQGIDLDPQEPAAIKPRKKGIRIGKDKMEQAVQAIASVLPPSNTNDENCISISDLVAKTKLDVATIKSAVQKMKREGTAESNGVRGPAGGWRRAKKN